jgi:hypothetical protein
MDHAQWWLIILAFVLGFVMTGAFTIRRVNREVPVGTSADTKSDAGVEAPTTDPAESARGGQPQQ